VDVLLYRIAYCKVTSSPVPVKPYFLNVIVPAYFYCAQQAAH